MDLPCLPIQAWIAWNPSRITRDGPGTMHTHAYGVSIVYTNFFKIKVPLVPPKPKELDIT